jgi:RNA recognition motif-containing protein
VTAQDADAPLAVRFAQSRKKERPSVRALPYAPYMPFVGEAPMATARRATVFVCHLPKSVTDEALEAAFARFGAVVSARVMFDKRTGESRGYGFVTFAAEEEAEAAVAEGNGMEVEGKRVKVEAKKEAAPAPVMPYYGYAPAFAMPAFPWFAPQPFFFQARAPPLPASVEAAHE